MHVQRAALGFTHGVNPQGFQFAQQPRNDGLFLHTEATLIAENAVRQIMSQRVDQRVLVTIKDADVVAAFELNQRGDGLQGKNSRDVVKSV